MLESLRQRSRRFGARMGVAVALAWLALAGVPCGAWEAAGVDLGHAHAVTTSTAADTHACPHCPQGGAKDQARAATATPADCNGVDDATLAKASPIDTVLAAAPATPVVVVAPDESGAQVIGESFSSRPPDIPLNLRYCTFLE